MIIDQNNTPGAYEFPSHGLLTRLTAPGMKLLLTFKQKLNVTSEAWVSHTHTWVQRCWQVSVAACRGPRSTGLLAASLPQQFAEHLLGL